MHLHEKPQARPQWPGFSLRAVNVVTPSRLTSLWLAAVVTAGAAGQPQDARGGAQSRPSAQPARIAPFQPGISIDWTHHSVRAAGRVVLRSGPLEFVACAPGKEHESLVLLEGTAAHLYQALGLVGFTPGHPPQWDEQAGRYSDPAGSLVAIDVTWKTDAGAVETADIASWMRDVEYARPVRPTPWVFGGSEVTADHKLAADLSGSVVAVVDFSDSLLSLTRRRSQANAELWAEANTEAVPPLGTPVTLVFRQPRAKPLRVRVDFRGDLYVDGRYETLAGGVDLLTIARRLDPGYVQTLEAAGTLESDLRRVRRALEAALPEQAIHIRRE